MTYFFVLDVWQTIQKRNLVLRVTASPSPQGITIFFFSSLFSSLKFSTRIDEPLIAATAKRLEDLKMFPLALQVQTQTPDTETGQIRPNIYLQFINKLVELRPNDPEIYKRRAVLLYQARDVFSLSLCLRLSSHSLNISVPLYFSLCVNVSFALTVLCV